MLSIIHWVVNIVLALATIFAIFFIMYQSRKHKRKQEELNRKFLDAEDRANSVRKKDIDPDLFFTPDLSELPPIPEGDPNKVARCAKRKMIYFRSPMSNLELKQEYGPAQMDYIAEFEENFNEFLKALTVWAGELAENREEQEVKEALWILGYAIAHGAEFRRTYKLAADLYAEVNDAETLAALFETTEKQYFRDPAVRLHILEYINSKIEEVDGAES